MNAPHHPPAPGAPHSLFEDAQGLVTGCLLVALAVVMFREAGLVTGGTTGVAFLTHYVSGWPLGAVLFVVNLPFYVFGWKALGPAFTVKTFAAVGLLSLFVEWLPSLLGFSFLHPAFAAVMAGLLAGCGILALIRHGASLGGIGIMAIYLQKQRGWRAGTVQMAFDSLILAAAFAVVEPWKALLSLLGAAALNMVIGVNHRSDRYFAG
jgi:uncharacterized membrane-anchored protein YitT (DUF2179 family)